MLCSHLSRASAGLLGVAGHALVFAPREVLAYLAPGTPTAATWIGQLLGAALIGLAWLNWLNRGALLGGIYARPVVLANAVFFLIGAASVFGTSSTLDATARRAQAVAGVLGLFALCYLWLMFRGPLERDFQASRAS
jgi:hypothetical protein